jgi:hypothetical protein
MLEQGAQIIQKREKERNQFHDTLNLNFNLSLFSLNPFIVFLKSDGQPKNSDTYAHTKGSPFPTPTHSSRIVTCNRSETQNIRISSYCCIAELNHPLNFEASLLINIKPVFQDKYFHSKFQLQVES